jgi:hypothetical protein
MIIFESRYQWEKNVEFIDVSAENRGGLLVTKVFHKPAAEPYILPYSSDHPRHMHSSAIVGALLRAIRLCSCHEHFDDKRLRLEMMFVKRTFERFFKQCNASELWRSFDTTSYQSLHRMLLMRPTRREKRRQIDDNDTQEECQVIDEPFESSARADTKVDYTFESGPIVHFGRDLLKLWKAHYSYPGSPMREVPLKLVAKPNMNLSCYLLRTRMLQRQAN